MSCWTHSEVGQRMFKDANIIPQEIPYLKVVFHEC
jgi:hypothetical protein